MRKIIFHYHLFKNAGTSVDALLKANFPKCWVTKEFSNVHELNAEQVASWCREDKNAVAFSSHTALLPPPECRGMEIFPIVFIRHPIDRIASAYHFEKKVNSDKPGADLAKKTTLAGYIDAHLANKKVNQCRNFQSHRLAQWFRGADGEMADLALQTLEALPFVGLVEAYDESIQRLTHWLSPHFPEFRAVVVAKNVGRNSANLEQKLAEIRREIGAACYQRLLEANAADMAVYHAVQERYANKTAAKTIMQFWHSAVLPEDIAPLVALWKRRNPGFQHCLFNDVTARAYIAQYFPEAYLAAFDSCAIPAMRSDFFRYAYLYKEGGVYVDAAITCTTPLQDWLDFSRELILVRKPAGRIINGFIAAKAGHPFLKAVLDQCVININEKISNNVWLVTGPGVINHLVKSQQPDSQPALLEFDFFKRHCPIHNSLEHKKTLHWSLMQKEQSIYVDEKTAITIADRHTGTTPPSSDENTITLVEVKLVLLGHPHCGSNFLAQYLTRAGLSIGHERLGDAGICSSWLTSRRNPAINAFIHRTKETQTTLVPELVCHFIHNPLQAIPSIVIENEFNQRNNHSFKRRREIIKRKYYIDLADYEPLTAATLSYIYWNKLAEEASPDITVRIEKMQTDLLPIIHYYGLSPAAKIPQANPSAAKWDELVKPKTDAETLIQLTAGKARLYLENYLNYFNNG